MRSHSVCRTCLSTKNLEPIFSVQQAISIANMVMECCSIQVYCGDGLPQLICAECIENLNKLNQFKSRCKAVDQQLRSNIAFHDCEESINSETVAEICKRENDTDADCDNFIEDYPSSPGETATVCENNSSPVNPDGMIGKPFEDDNSSESSMDDNALKKATEMKSCVVCDKLIFPSKLKDHIKIHSKDKNYKCPVCGKIFTQIRYLGKHRKIHTGDRPHDCSICFKSFTESQSLKIHMWKHTGEYPYSCSSCHKQFPRKQLYDKHLQIHITGNSNANKVGKRKRSYEDLQFTCSICSKKYSTKANLMKHTNTHTGERNYLCNVCGKRFICKTHLTQHGLVHSRIKTFKCDLCPKSYSRKMSLQVHQLSHTGEKPYECNICNKQFTQLGGLNGHMLVHSGVKPHKCNFCGKPFTRKDNLRVHIRQHTGETPYLCTICNRGFHESTSLKKHKRKRHNLI